MKNIMKGKKVIILTVLMILALIVTIASAATLTVQVATNKQKYNQGVVVTVKAIAKNGTTRITSSGITSAKVTIKDPSGVTKVNAATMTKDTYTGQVYYNYTLAATATKGNWTATVTIQNGSSNSGSATQTFKVQAPVPDHSTLVTNYTGTATCITCHNTQANAMFNSVHYQWKGANTNAIELQQAGVTDSKLGGINNFCIWPDASWVTIFNKTNGTTGPGGCAICHAGLGLKPTATVSQQQLENIDCLICHSPSYKRIAVQNADLTYSLVPDPTIDIQAAAKNIQRPSRTECMRCHEKSGGGDNYKRGDIESTAKSCNKAYDVHMGTDGQNFTCQDCHKTENHKMAGRGIDMRATDSTTTLNCENCHTQLPHRSYNTNYADLNRHSDKVNCSVCHVPTFAKTVATDVYRDWSVMEIDTAKALWDPFMIKQTNVMPKYTWFNGSTHFYKFKDAVALDSRGVQKIAWPDGGFVDPAGKMSKLYPVKIHQAYQPMETTSMQLLGLKNKIAFETGDVTAAIKAGAAAAGITYTGHTFVPTEQYQGIFHGVGPKTTALSCSNQPCHGNENRIPFTSIGYERRGTTAQMCDVCHSARTYSSFTSLHSNHRDRKNCEACHGTGYPLKEPVTTLCDNCHSLKTFTNANYIHSQHVQSKGYDCSNCHTYTANMASGGHREDH